MGVEKSLSGCCLGYENISSFYECLVIVGYISILW